MVSPFESRFEGMDPTMEKARIGWWVYSPTGRRQWCLTERWARWELRHEQEIWAICQEHFG
jgi:hypothetical protein